MSLATLIYQLNEVCKKSFEPDCNFSEVMQDLNDLILELSDFGECQWIDVSLKQSFFFNHQQANKEHASNRLKDEDAKVYLLRGSVTGHYKIGVSANLHSRVRQVANGVSEELTLVSSSKGGQTFEADLHKKYKDQKIKGEWFCLENADVEEIKSLMEARK